MFGDMDSHERHLHLVDPAEDDYEDAHYLALSVPDAHELVRRVQVALEAPMPNWILRVEHQFDRVVRSSKLTSPARWLLSSGKCDVRRSPRRDPAGSSAGSGVRTRPVRRRGRALTGGGVR